MIQIKYLEEEKRAVAMDEEQMAGECTYVEADGRWIIEHTRVKPEYGGRGIAKLLVEEILNQAKAQGKKIEAQCSYAYKVLKEEAPQILTE